MSISDSMYETLFLAMVLGGITGVLMIFIMDRPCLSTRMKYILCGLVYLGWVTLALVYFWFR